MSVKRGEVRGELLAAARRLCARDGVGATSLRRVIEASGANLNAVHYHFGSRDGLITALVDEAQDALNRERFELFDALDDDPLDDDDGLRRVLAAGYGPLFRRALGPGNGAHRDGLLTLAQLRTDPGPDGAWSMDRHAAAFLERFEPLVRRALRLSPARFRSALRLVNSTAWDFALRCDVHDTVAASGAPGRARERLLAHFLDFATAGLRGLAGAPR